MIKHKKIILVLLVIVTAMAALPSPQVLAAFDQNMVISDSNFEDYGSMSAVAIDAFLNSFPGSCISSSNGFVTPDPQGWSSSQNKYLYGGNVTGGRAIYDVAQLYHVNPKVILSTLQKEQSIPNGGKLCHQNTPDPNAPFSATPSPNSTFTCIINGKSQPCTYACPDSYGGGCMNIALGYGCPYYCAVANEGFSVQLTLGTWLLRFAEQRAYGKLTGYAGYESGDEGFCYHGIMTPGYRARSASATACGGSSDNVAVYYDGTGTLADGNSVSLSNGATSSLYNFTPFISGNNSFFNIYSNWFGSPISVCHGDVNVLGVGSGSKLLPYKLSSGNQTNLAFASMNNTGSACTELHTDNTALNAWAAHVATGMRATDPATGTLVASKSRVDNRESLNYINYIGGGQVEIHRLSPDLQKLPGYYDVRSNLSNVTSTSGMFVAGDFFGIGYDQLAYIIYSNGTGKLEIHMFDPTLTRGVGFYDLVTDIGGASANTGTLLAGDFLGRGYSQLAYITYGSTEVHLLDIRGGKAARLYEVPTNLSGATSTNSTFVAGDFLGIGHDQLIFAIYNNGDGSNGGLGHVETHMFNPALTKINGTQDKITNITGFDPTK